MKSVATFVTAVAYIAAWLVILAIPWVAIIGGVATVVAVVR